jgi:hypothetical protein
MSFSITKKLLLLGSYLLFFCSNAGFAFCPYDCQNMKVYCYNFAHIDNPYVGSLITLYNGVCYANYTKLGEDVCGFYPSGAKREYRRICNYTYPFPGQCDNHCDAVLDINYSYYY